MKHSLALLFATTALAAAPTAAAAAAGSEAADRAEQAAAQQPVPGSDHVHEQLGNEIIVTAPFVRDLNVLAGTDVLTGSELVREMRPQLGDTLARLPGVSATSFTPGASRPVLRGFQGERVRVLVDGIGSIDVSNTSADHAVTVDPLTADRIEVLHGPAVLLFGSQAIGGAVNVFDRRIPRRAAPPERVHLDALGTYGSAANERSAGVGIDLPLANGGFVIHLDGSYRNTDDLRTGGYILSRAARAEQLEIAAEEAAEGHDEEAAEALALANMRGRLPNSHTETRTAGIGAALLRANGNLGFSVSYFGSRYGVPDRPGGHHGHHGEDHDHDHDHDHDDDEHGGHGPVTIDLEQIRADLRGEVIFGGSVLDRLRLRLGFADYEHTEFEGEEVGTVFRTEGMEGRLELVQRKRGGWSGVVGGQFFNRKLSAVGAEAFLPPNTMEQFGIFTLQELASGPLEFEGAARFERSRAEARTAGLARSFSTVSAAAGASYEFAPLIRFGVNVSRAERAPSPEELFSNGPHAATQSFEIGDPGLKAERSLGGELYFRAQRPRYDLSLSFFYNRFDDFIFQARTGDEEDGLPVFGYFQRDAEHWGFEFGANTLLTRVAGYRIVLDGVADYVRATIDEGGGPVPRIPPLRLLGGLEAQSDALDARIEVERTFAQKRVAELENPSDAFNMVNASLAWRPWGRRNPTSIVLAASNIFDVEARRHASLTRDFVPLAGRDIRLSARISF